MSTIYGTSGNDTLNGTAYADVIYGMSGNDRIYGNAGDDYIDGMTGNDAMYGGTGNDTYVVDSSYDIIGENVGEGIDTVYSNLTSYSLGANVENLVLNTGYTYYGYGNSLDNQIIGSSYNNTLYGLQGNDTLFGGAGVDTMYGGTGNDVMYVDNINDSVIEYANEGTQDLVWSGLSDYTLTDNVEWLALSSGANIYWGDGNSLNNYIQGNENNNALYGHAGNDTIYGYTGDDFMWGGTGNDTLFGGIGNATLADGNDTIHGEDGDDQIFGENGNDYLYGEAGNDWIEGTTGNDTISGGTGNDTLYGGIGNNTYQFSAGDNQDYILDEAGTDKITFDNTVSKSNIALFKDASNNLFLDYGSVAATDQIGIVNQSTYTIERVEAGGYYLSDSTINQAIQDMAAYATANGISFTSVDDVKANADLMNIISNSWQAA